jgi:hypothetical protein
MEHAGKSHIIDVVACTLDEPIIFDPLDTVTNSADFS